MNTSTFGQVAQGPQRGLYHFLGFLIKDIAVGPQRGEQRLHAMQLLHCPEAPVPSQLADQFESYPLVN